MKNFIPKPYEKEQVSFRISIDMLKEIDHLSVQYNMSRSEFINRCIEFAVEHMSEENGANTK